MPYDGYEPITIEKFGGLNTLIDPTNLPIFASPDCQDVEFIYGLTRTRPGITSQFSPLANNPTVNYIKTYITPAEAIRMLALDSLGTFYKENPQGTLVNSGVIENTGVYGNSVSLFGREYLAIGDGKFGTSIPRQFDDTNFDRVSQVGPGAAPMASEEVNVQNLVASPGGTSQPAALSIAAVNGAVQVGSIITFTTTTPHGFAFIAGGLRVTVAGVTNPLYNGTWGVLSIPSTTTFTAITGAFNTSPSGNGTAASATVTANTTSAHGFSSLQSITIAGVAVAGYNVTASITVINSTQFQYLAATGGLAASGNGTASAAGNVVSGPHKVAVLFVTRQGAFTAPSPSSTWSATGGRRVVITNIPVGPPNVLQRILLFTASGGSSFFYQTNGSGLFSGNFIIADNTTTSTTIDFSDTTLLTGTNADSLFGLIELGECSGVTQYNSRLFWWGERKKDTNGASFVNLTFDGGFTNPGSLPNFPLGWTPDAVFSPGGASALQQGQPVIWGDAYAIVGNGLTATRGMITQSAYQDSLGTAILQPNVQYSVRARIRGNRVLTQGTLHIHLLSNSAGINTTGIAITAAQTNGSAYTEVIAVLGGPFTTIPSDLVLRIYADGTPISNDMWLIENIEPFPTAQPYNMTIVRSSFAEQPEAYDGVTGFLDVAPSNGQAVRSGFVIRNNLYLVKERSLYATQDDGTNEPNQWNVQEVSTKVGTLSVRGVGMGDEWAIIAGQSGAYYFDGSEPQKLSQEIQPTWDAINWAFGHLLDVKVDTKRKRVYIDVPFGTSTVNNKKFTLDYTDGFGDPNPTNTVNIAGIGRKWVPWTGNVVGNSQDFILRADGTQPLFIGNGAGNGKIYGLDLTGTVFTDDGGKINDYWQSGFAQDTGRLDFGYIAANAIGSGSLGLVLRKADQGWLGNARSWFLNPTGFHDLERQINITSERLAIRFGSIGVGDNFSLQGVTIYARPSVSATRRGVNV